ncbi:MAG: hypothetical protein H3C51_10395 [Rubellimicrobium sp.]|nr:hypothetical protein [Rubellimicrobium sp.]
MSEHLVIAAVAFGFFLVVAALSLAIGAMAAARDDDVLVRWQRGLADRVGLGRPLRALEPVVFRLALWISRLMALVALAVALWHGAAAIFSD